MTEQDLIRIAQTEWYKLRYVEDRNLITKNVIDNLTIENVDWYHEVLSGVNPENISKEKALQLIKYDFEIYGLLTKELQEDKDMLSIITKDLYYLPKALFNNKVGLNYVLGKWNVEDKSWAVCDFRKGALIIKPNINEKKYIVYVHGLLKIKEDTALPSEIYSMKEDSILIETFLLTEKLDPICVAATETKHLD